MRGEPPTTRRPPEKQVRRGEQQRMIRRSLDRLPPAYRQALVLREIHELSYEEMARALDCSYDSARQLVHRARLRFREAHGLRLLIAGASERCTQLGDLLSAYQDGELTAEAESEVRDHLAECPHCREKQDDLRAVGALLAIVPPLLPSPQWTQYVLQQLRQGTPPGVGGGKVNARMVDQGHPHARRLPDGQGEGAAGDGAAPPAGGTGVAGGALHAAGSGRWLAFALFGAAGALGVLGVAFLAWRAARLHLTTPVMLSTARIIESPAPPGTPTPRITWTAAPSLAGVLPTLSPTPSATPTLTPTDGAPLGTATQNANCRLGPGTGYRNVATLLEGQSAELAGRNAESTWWWIGTPGGGGHCWVWGGSLVIVGPAARLRVVPAPPTETPTPGDTQGPVVTLSYAPSGSGRPTDHDKISLTANASDSGGVARIEIWFRAPGQSQASLVRSCADATHCSFSGGPYPAGTGEAFARAQDAAGNLTQSSLLKFAVLVYLQ